MLHKYLTYLVRSVFQCVFIAAADPSIETTVLQMMSVGCGLLLQVKRGLSVCLSVGHNREPYRNS